MAEALAAIGLASNLLQFVQVGVQAVRLAKDLYKSPEQLSHSHTQLRDLTSDLKKSMRDVRGRNDVSPSDALAPQIKACNTLADELLDVLGELAIDPNKDRRLESVKKSYKAYRKRQDIKDLAGRIEVMRSRICDYLNLEFM